MPTRTRLALIALTLLVPACSGDEAASDALEIDGEATARDATLDAPAAIAPAPAHGESEGVPLAPVFSPPRLRVAPDAVVAAAHPRRPAVAPAPATQRITRAPASPGVVPAADIDRAVAWTLPASPSLHVWIDVGDGALAFADNLGVHRVDAATGRVTDFATSLCGLPRITFDQGMIHLRCTNGTGFAPAYEYFALEPRTLAVTAHHHATTFESLPAEGLRVEGSHPQGCVWLAQDAARVYCFAHDRHAIEAWDVATGARAASAAVPAMLSNSAIAVRWPRVFFVERSPDFAVEPWGSAAVVASADLQSGQRWVSSLHVPSDSQLVAGAHAVYACTGYGALYGLGADDGVARVRAHIGGGAPLVVGLPGGRGERVITRSMDGPVLAVDPASAPVGVAPRVRIDGAITGPGRHGGMRVWVNETIVRTRADGRFRAVLRARDAVVVRVDHSDAVARCQWGDPVTVQLAAAGAPTRVSVASPADYCMCHACD